MRKRSLAWVLTLVMLLSILPLGAAAQGFTDVQAGSYYETPVQWAVEQEITNGTSPTTFSPNSTCTRGQVVTFLWRAAGSPAPSSKTNPFTDVQPDDYYYKAVLWAVEREITNGTSASTFSPDQGCTRGQVVTFLWRAAGSPASAAKNPFSDVAKDAYYCGAVLWAVANEITNGTSPTTFSPESTCTRAQVVTFLYRARDLLGALSADTCRVTFRMGDPSDSVYQLSVVVRGAKMTKPEQPRRPGFEFLGWFTDAACKQAYAFDTPVKRDLTLYAGWLAPSGDAQNCAVDPGQIVCAITELSVENGTAAAVVSTGQTATLTITILDEKTGKECAAVSAKTPERGQQMRIELPLDAELPEHFIALATLRDAQGKELCDPFRCIRYTEAFAAFEAKSVEDFPEELVVNFDDDNETNFGVLNENVQRIDSKDDENVLTTLCGDEQSIYYIVKNPSAAVRGLAVGDDVYLAGSNGETALFRVGSVETLPDGSLRFTQGKSDSIMDFYTYIDLDAWFGEESETGAQPMGEIVDIDENPELSFIEQEFSDVGKDLKLDGHLNVKGIIHFRLRLDATLVELQEVEFLLSCEIVIDAEAGQSATAEYSKDIQLAEFPIPLGSTGLAVVLEPGITLGAKAEGGVTFSYTKSEEYGVFCTYDETGLTFGTICRHDDPTIKASMEAGFELKIGPKLDLSLAALGDTLKATLNSAVCLVITGEAKEEVMISGPEEAWPDSVHQCELCIEGTVGWEVDVGAGVSIEFLGMTLVNQSWPELFSVDGPIRFMGDPEGRYYCSLLNAPSSVLKGKFTFAGGECPNRSYRITITASDASGNAIPEAAIVIKNRDGTEPVKSTPYTTYLYTGTYEITVTAMGYQPLTKTVKVDKRETVDFQFEPNTGSPADLYRQILANAASYDYTDYDFELNVSSKDKPTGQYCYALVNMGSDYPTPALLVAQRTGEKTMRVRVFQYDTKTRSVLAPSKSLLHNAYSAGTYGAYVSASPDGTGLYVYYCGGNGRYFTIYLFTIQNDTLNKKQFYNGSSVSATPAWEWGVEIPWRDVSDTSLLDQL